MKKFIILLFSVAIGFFVSSCKYYTESIEFGGYDPAELSQDKVHFKEAGGDITIYCYNYSSWYISSLLEYGQNESQNNYLTISDNENGIMQEANGKGIKVVVEDDNPRKEGTAVRIIVDACQTHKSWELCMMISLSAFSTIEITQN